MRRAIAIAGFALSLTSSVAMAQERAGDAALGALSGAVVLGPIGAVAGAVVGYTAGPSISRSWGMHRSSTSRHVRKSARQAAPTATTGSEIAQDSTASVASAPQPIPPQAPPAAPHDAAPGAPPVQALE